ncbi:zinc ABC transporter substrate-binding protein [Actinomyces lilanjuaniae]|uniref:Zinc ABC transporter substrate-binding protein n=1 Tax=Actinomyces lilanjuaniae TaxID=2321394 RepID=A0ABN5PS15_9ACTO|nr:metal ABC transporter substrate-binding protein [Actinomyces lilanjuaniae]AYD89912.1 zinc ABC transporter substrate-binding protein [Actinomyces lilanjuaniae]
MKSQTEPASPASRTLRDDAHAPASIQDRHLSAARRSRPAAHRLGAGTAALVLAAGLSSCSALSGEDTSASQTAAGSSDTDATLAVSTSFYPIAYLATAVGGEHVTVTSVTPTSVEPHDYELSPKDVTALEAADVIAYVPGFQPSLDEAVSQVSGPTVLDLGEAANLVHHEGAGHDHEAEEADEHDADEHDADEHDHATGEDGETDPHFWLDPQRMVATAGAVQEALATADPDHAGDYEDNLETLTITLTDLDTSYTEGLDQCERTTFVTSHAAFGYLADRYDLTQASVSGLDPEAEPSPAELAEIKEVVEETGTTTIFTEELVSTRTAEALASETGTTTAVLSPVESAPADGDYVDVMSTNLEALRSGLSCQ